MQFMSSTSVSPESLRNPAPKEIYNLLSEVNVRAEVLTV